MKAIATATKTNTYGLVLYDLNADAALVGVNDEEPKWIDIDYDDEGEPYIMCYGMTYISDFIRVPDAKD